MTLFRSRRFLLSALALAVTATGLAACMQAPSTMRPETVKRLTMPSFMHHRTIPADPFQLTVYERVHQRGQKAVIYLEGDSNSYIKARTPGRKYEDELDTVNAHPLKVVQYDPTPVNPVALHLATRDNSPNVIWLPLPCQYTQLEGSDGKCPQELWHINRYGDEVLTALNTALDDIKRRHDIAGFELVGYSGGGTLATLLAGTRRDVLSLRTVAGILDTDLYTRVHEYESLTGSLNPTSVAAAVANIPQAHFVGNWDEKVTTLYADSYRKKAGTSTCIRTYIVSKVEHESGWVNKWPTLLKEPLDCRVAGSDTFTRLTTEDSSPF